MGRKVMTEELAKKILAMRQEGQKSKDIAAQLGLGFSTVQRVFTQANQEGADKLRERVVALRSQGYNYTEVGKLLGITKQRAAYQGARAQKLAERSIKRATTFKATKGATNGREHHESNSDDIALQNHVSYLFGRTEAQIEGYCDGAGISRADVTRQLADLFRRKALR